MIGEYMLKGASVAAWLIGFIATLGIFIGIVTLFCMAMMEIFGKDGHDEDTERDAQRAGEGIPEGAEAGRNSYGPVDLRRKHRGFGSSI